MANSSRTLPKEELGRHDERLRILHQIDRALLAAESPEAIAASALPPLREVLGVPRAIVNLFDLAAGEVEWLAAAGRKRIHAGPGVRYSIRLMGDVEALKGGEPQFIDVHALPPSPEVDALLASGVHAYAVVPMIARGELIGALSFGGESCSFSEEQMSIAKEAAAQFAIALMQARLNERVTRQAQELRSAFEDTNVAMVLTDINNRFVRVNAAFARMFGRTRDEMLGMSMADITHPDDLAESYARRQALLAGETSYFQVEKRYLHKDGRVLWGLTNVSLIRDDRGKPLQYVGQVQDITERKRLEEQFRQAQKMEAVGRLAGGVAHDFNNLLTIIFGYSEVLMARLPSDGPDRPLIQEIQTAAEQAAMLTRQLLAFSRKEVIEPEILDLNAIVADTAKMLCRLVGEDVRVSTVLSPALKPVRADAGQLEQVIMNLVVNARDAMPQGGKLTIETKNVELDEHYARLHADVMPGGYVMLAVSDNGCGMSQETQAHIFEPFFTTKEPGKGTGLGLATVYGIVKHTGGHIGVYSELGQGTTFKVYLPPAQDGVSSGKSLHGDSHKPRGNETILLVEDEDAVREIARQALETQGYKVLEASDGGKALAISEEYSGTIDLIVTDVVMPGVGGRAVAETIRLHHPSIKTLYLSGYTDDAVVRHGILEAEVAFLQKPFTPTALACKVRQVLDH
jgi:two-component system cell cycle sensor histidine kinase/response regulator CckA